MRPLSEPASVRCLDPGMTFSVVPLCYEQKECLCSSKGVSSKIITELGLGSDVGLYLIITPLKHIYICVLHLLL